MGIRLDWWRLQIGFSLEWVQNPASILLSLVYSFLFVALLWQYRAEFNKRVSLFTLLGLLLVYPLQSFAVIYTLPISSMPGSPEAMLSSSFAISLGVLLLLTVIGTWLGAGPGLLVGFVAGLLRAWYFPMVFNDVFALAVWGALSGMLLRQSYRGTFFALFRKPLVALPLAALFASLLLSLNRLINAVPLGGLLVADYALTLLRTEVPLWLFCGIGIGAMQQLSFLHSRLRLSHSHLVTPAYSRSLRARFTIIVIPLVLLSIILSVLAVTSRAITLARDQALAEMSRSAANAEDGIKYFSYTGFNLLENFAGDQTLRWPDSQQWALERSRLVVPFFHELLLVDSDGRVIAYVPDSLTDTQLTPDEANLVVNALQFGFSQMSYLTQMPSGELRLTMSHPIFEDPVAVSSGGEVWGVLLGRVQLDVNPNMRRALQSLQATRGEGVGFVLDARGMTVLHTDPTQVLQIWRPNTESLSYPIGEGLAYEDVSPEGHRVLTFERPVDGTHFRVVLRLPFSTVLETATAISSPLLVVQLVMGITLLLVIPLLAARITRPLHTVADAAHQIAQGNLGIPVHISGEDEVAQLGGAFEQMRLRLRDRLNDLSLLLQVSQSVSATLALDEGVPLILNGALEETGAAVARFFLLGSGDRPQQSFAVGRTDQAFPGLDRAFAVALSRRREPLLNQNLDEGRGGGPHAGPLRSVAAFPVRTQNRVAAILWVGAVQPEAFDEARVNFLTTLASQAAVLVENARLFDAAEGGRQRLAAILSSTTDAILVTDQEARLLLSNPAAQALLQLTDMAYGRLLTDLELPEALQGALSRSTEEETGTPVSVEIPFADGRTFYASVAPIFMGRDVIGRVAVMRDITHFKELDEMKSDFVATVSHDLRAPLTFIRGYATMLMMVGELNEKQHEYLNHILQGIEQMSALINDLLNLRRIEAGVGIRHESCHIGLILVEAVDSMRARATAKGIGLRLEPSEGAPMVIGDRTLLRQAIGNLVDNAIKYTRVGGDVRVGLSINDAEGETVVAIADNGIGIAAEDQVRLFEKFYRVKRRETGDISGTGLGLALVKSIVERHNGRVWVESQLNKGSTFFIALPIIEET